VYFFLKNKSALAYPRQIRVKISSGQQSKTFNRQQQDEEGAKLIYLIRLDYDLDQAV
jgi:hypothetical protein